MTKMMFLRFLYGHIVKVNKDTAKNTGSGSLWN